MKIKIISDGTKHGTKVIDAETGNTIEGVVSIEWTIDSWLLRNFSLTTIKIANVSLELTGDAAMELLPAYAAIAMLEGEDGIVGQ